MADRVVAFVLFPGVTILDLVGPLTVLEQLPPPFRTTVVGARIEPMPTEAGIAVTPQQCFEDVPAPHVLVVPGGPGALTAMVDDRVQAYVRAGAETAAIVTSVCTGALVLAAAGLLTGRRATTHWAYAAELEKLGTHYVRERWVEDGKYLCAAGVSAGIDMGLMLAARLTDEATARRIQLGIEYDPQPPFGGIDWATVGPEVVARQRRGGTGKMLGERGAEIFRARPDLARRLLD